MVRHCLAAQWSSGLQLEVFDKDRLGNKDDPLGGAEVALGPLLEKEGPQELELPLSKQGVLRLRLEVTSSAASGSRPPWPRVQ